MNPMQVGSNQKIALITGASSGIGRAYAEQLAMQGYALVLIARRKDRLEEIARQVLQRYNCVSEIIQADLSQPDQIESLAKKISGMPALDLLINNAGFGIQGPFAESDPKRETSMIHLHVLATNRLCHAALPGMMQNKAGSIINVASVAGLMLTPNHINYDATKGYMILFSKALADEVKPYNIKIQALCPGYTRTEFHHNAEFEDFNMAGVPKILWMSPEELVQKSLSALAHRKVVYVPGFINQLMVWIFRQPWLHFIIWPVYKHLTKK